MNTSIIPKNRTQGMTAAWKRERDNQMKFYQDTPFYGSALAEKLYTTIKQAIPSLIQASVCGYNVAVVTYKQDADKARHLLANSFKKPVKQKECPYTEYVTTYLLNR